MKTILILGDLFTFPQYDAHAATGRAYAIASGLKSNRVNSTIVTFSNIYDKYAGISDGVEFYVPLEQEKRNEHFTIRNYHKIKKYINTFNYLKHTKKSVGLDAILLYTRTPSLMLFSFFCCKLLKSKLILEVTEFPTKDFNKYSIIRPIFPYLFLKLFDGFSCISSPISEYCSKYRRKNAKVIIVPPLVIQNSFANQPEHDSCVNEYVLYSGTLSFHRDGIDNLIKAFKKIHEIFPSIKLLLGGKWINDFVRDDAINLIHKLKLEGIVIFTGFVSPDELNKLVFNAKILCVPRKNNHETKSAFPTKLIEYISTGLPVLTTNVGDISKYLTNGENVYLAEPDSVEAIEEKLTYILKNYEEALNVGLNGKNLANQEFTSETGTLKLIKLLADLSQDRVGS